MKSYLSLSKQKQLWIWNSKEEHALAEALAYNIYKIQSRVYLSQEEKETVATLTIILARLGYRNATEKERQAL